MKTATIRAKSSQITEVLIYDEIGKSFFGDGIDAKQFREQLKAVKTAVINLRINTVRVAQDSLVMIHNPWTMVGGHAAEMRRMADLLDKVGVQILDRYARKTGKKTSRDQLAAMMDAETWFTGQEAVDVGLADEVTGAMAFAAHVSPKLLARLGWNRAAKLPARIRTQMENPLTFEAGDCVQWMEIDAEELSAELHCGCVEEIGPEVGIPGTGLTLTGTADDPAVRVIEEDEDEDECCWYLLRASQLREDEDEDEPEVPMRPGMAAAALAAETEKRRAIAAQL